LRLLRRYADSVTLVLDGDEAGQRKSNEVLALFVAEELDLRILSLPDGQDPCDFLLEHGAKSMQSLLDAAPDALEHAFLTHTRDIDLLRDTHRANQALERLLAVIAQAPRLTTDTSSTKQLRERQVVARLAREFRIEESTLRGRIAELRRARPVSSTAPRSVESPRVLIEDLHPYEAELLEILALHHELAETAFDELSLEQLISLPGKAIGQTYQTILQRGEPAEFSRVLAELEDRGLKNVLVMLDEHAALKDEQAQEDAPARLRRLMDDFLYRAQQPQQQQTVAALEQQVYSPQEELDVLQQLVEHERKRQGIPAPTDG
jgi:DNA primase